MRGAAVVLFVALACGPAFRSCGTAFRSDSQADKRPAFLRLSKQEQHEAIQTARQAIQLWLNKDYERLYAYLAHAGNFYNQPHDTEAKRKARYIKWCKAWRERNLYNSRLTNRERIENMRVVAVSWEFLTAFIMLHMKEDYFNRLISARWHPGEKMAFVEYSIRGKRYREPLIKENGRWKLVGIPLQMNEAMIAELEQKRVPRQVR